MALELRVLALLLSAVTGGAQTAALDQGAQKSTQSPCDAWQTEFGRLSDADRGLLTQYGIVLRASWIISPALVSDCRERLGLEDFLRAALAGNVKRPQQEFLRQNQATVHRVLKKVWPKMGHSPAVPDDGAFNEEKWGILRYAELSPSNLIDLLRESLASDGLSGSFVDFVLTNPQLGIERDIEEIIRREERATTRRDRTSTTEIYCLALLYSMGRKDIPERLSRLSASKRASQIERCVITDLIEKIKAKERIHWQDVEILESQF